MQLISLHFSLELEKASILGTLSIVVMVSDTCLDCVCVETFTNKWEVSVSAAFEGSRGDSEIDNMFVNITDKTLVR